MRRASLHDARLKEYRKKRTCKMREKVEGFLLWKAFLKIERFVMVLCSVAIVLTIVTNVVCRYVLHVTFDGYDEIVIILALWLYYVGGLYGSYEDCQIKADVLSVMVSKELVLRLFDVIQKIFTLVISIVLAVWAIEYFQFCLKMGGRTAILHIPMMVSRFALVFGYVTPVIYNIYHLVLVFVERKETKKLGGADNG